MHSPIATYRIQFTPSFTFAEGEKIGNYLSRLGISDLYASPVFAARKGSEHGYDVVNMNEINEELGGREGFEKLREQLRGLGMAWLQDAVPNHRCFDGANYLLMDILEKGPKSKYYYFFDILWDHPYENIRGQVLAPFLGDFYASILERGELKLTYDQRGFRIAYWEMSFPLRLRSYLPILTHNLRGLRDRKDRKHQDIQKFQAIVNFLKNLEKERQANPEFDFHSFLKNLIWELYENSPIIREHIDQAISFFNGEPGNATTFDPLDEILQDQFYRLSFWKVGTEELNYRRFFSINELISLRVEDEDVLKYTHQLLFELVKNGQIQGIRLDHIDGLYDPTEYLNRLRNSCPETYIVAEKILEGDEDLPAYWPIQGTTGYDFLSRANGLFCDTKSEGEMERVYRSFTGLTDSYARMVDENKRAIIGRHMAGDIDNLALILKENANRYRYGNDLTMYGLRRALVEILTQFPIYRTYVNHEVFDDRDRTVFEEVIEEAKRGIPRLERELELIRSYMLGERHDELDEEDQRNWTNFIMRLQQYSGPLMAKGVEDTTFYVYNRLTSLNEVGCDPTHFGATTEEFHAFQKKRASTWPFAMNASATHDTKRGEDTRARINVISENPAEWEENLKVWNIINQKHKRQAGGRECPSANDEYLLYQTLLAASPFDGFEADNFKQRIKDYAIKAAREAKLDTSWLRPDQGYEEALLAYIDAVLEPGEDKSFFTHFNPFRKRMAFFGMLNSLSQTLLKLSCPGVPDIYQGAEMWDFSLVDPDNRRPVDYQLREKALEEIEAKAEENPAALLGELLASPEDGRIKLYLIHQVLKARHQYAELFLKGSYEPVPATGEHSDHVVAFARRWEGQTALVVVSRFLSRLHVKETLPLSEGIWKGTQLQTTKLEGTFRSVLTGEKITDFDLEKMLQPMPCCVLISE